MEYGAAVKWQHCQERVRPDSTLWQFWFNLALGYEEPVSAGESFQAGKSSTFIVGFVGESLHPLIES